jgi:glycosyltransferase involved in cell wall biosynthesis
MPTAAALTLIRPLASAKERQRYLRENRTTIMRIAYAIIITFLVGVSFALFDLFDSSAERLQSPTQTQQLQQLHPNGHVGSNPPSIPTDSLAAVEAAAAAAVDLTPVPLVLAADDEVVDGASSHRRSSMEDILRRAAEVDAAQAARAAAADVWEVNDDADSPKGDDNNHNNNNNNVDPDLDAALEKLKKRDEQSEEEAAAAAEELNKRISVVGIDDDEEHTMILNPPVAPVVIALRPIDSADAQTHVPTPTTTTAPSTTTPILRENKFGSAARSRISRISRVVEQSDLNKMKLGAGAEQQTDHMSPPVDAAAAAAAAAPADSSVITDRTSLSPAASAAVSEIDFDSLEQDALDEWRGSSSTENPRGAADQQSVGYVDPEGNFVERSRNGGSGGWDAASMSALSVVWDIGASGCTGWGLEASNMILSLAPHIKRLGIITGKNTWCPGLTNIQMSILEDLRNAPINEWGPVDVWVSHKPPPRYPRQWPYRGAVTVNQPPLFIIGRSMTEVHRVPASWVTSATELVDEVWLPSTQSRSAFSLSGINPLQMQIIPEPIDPTIFNPLQTSPFSDAELGFPLRSLNFLSIFKFEERKGWRELIRAWVEEFSEKDDVTLTLHTYLPNHFPRDDPQTIEDTLADYIDTLHFGDRDLVARPLPLANLFIHTKELLVSDMPRLYASFDFFVLPTHGEGWGMPLLEAMAMGLPTISTNWGGQLEFMSPTNSYLIPVEKFEPADPPRDFGTDAQWAKPSVSVLRQAMRHCVTHPDHTVPIGARGRSDVLNKFNTGAVADIMLNRFQQILPIVRERRQAVAEGRKVVRGSHLHTTFTPAGLSPAAIQSPSPSQSPGLLARKGGAAAEATQLAEAKIKQILNEQVRLSQRTGWKAAGGQKEQQQHAPTTGEQELPQQQQPIPEAAATTDQTLLQPNLDLIPRAPSTDSQIAQAITRQFGSFESFKKEFTDKSIALFGSEF